MLARRKRLRVPPASFQGSPEQHEPAVIPAFAGMTIQLPLFRGSLVLERGVAEVRTALDGGGLLQVLAAVGDPAGVEDRAIAN